MNQQGCKSQASRTGANRRPWSLTGMLVLAAAGLCLAVADARADSVVRLPTADSYVDASQPTLNFGSSAQLRLDGSPVITSFLRFDVSGLVGSVTSAQLRVFASSAQTMGYTARAVADQAWTETGITAANAPAAGAALGSSGPVTAGTWTSVDVTGTVAAGTGSFQLSTTNATAASLQSRTGVNAPQLVIATTTATEPPANSALPAIAGTTTVGSTLTATDGTWTGTPAPTFARQWQRCATSCADIAGATASSYLLVGADAGQSLQIVVTATNTSGSSASASPPTATIDDAQAPANSAPPTIAGTPIVGSTLTASDGTWTGSPAPAITRQWQRCATSCTDIAGATGTTYAPVGADAGQVIQVVVTATNASGSAVATSGQTTTVAPAAGDGGDPTIAAAGDIACDPASASFNGGAGKPTACAQRAVSDLIAGKGYSAVLPLGDNQYYCGGLANFQASYDLSWGGLLPVSHPVAGNHEYLTSGGTGCDATGTASGYFAYFGSRAGSTGQGYYSYDVATWHLIALNSNCANVGGCSASSAQGRWLAADLAAHPTACTLAYWHIPLFSSGGHAWQNTSAIWTALYNAGADVVLNGHDHIYERFAPQTAAGAVDDARGLREFIVGTGGANHTALATIAPNSEVRNTNTFGILKLTLHAGSYDWLFVPAAGTGSFTDSGTGACH